MNKWLAHSTDKKKDIGLQLYKDHVAGVVAKCQKILCTLQPYIREREFNILSALVVKAVVFHDMGKLCDNCQRVLNGGIAGVKMPNHVDAGTAYLLKSESLDNQLAAWIIYSHHHGYQKNHIKIHSGWLRDEAELAERCSWIPGVVKSKISMRQYTDQNLVEIYARHNTADIVAPDIELKSKEITGLLMRMALSVLVAADHYDTAKNYGEILAETEVPLLPKERLEKLDEWNREKQATSPRNDRNIIRQEVYEVGRYNPDNIPFVECSSEVGTGKTTALLAYALACAEKFDYRKIIYIAPYTGIISQNVQPLRLVCLPFEDPLLVVAEHHHQVDSDDLPAFPRRFLKRHTADWNAAIIATTAVQFFETLAGIRTGKLKKLYQLAGSIIIIDESHNCIPIELWPQALKWLTELVEKFHCKVVFASGSLTKPWKLITDLDNFSFNYDVPSIIPESLAKKTLQKEKDRIPIEYRHKPLVLPEFCHWIKNKQFYGPKIVVCNTIRNAALIAETLRRTTGEDRVLHISTCLTPQDRERIIKIVQDKLKNYYDWTLVATSCVEAGIDFSFQWGFRENAGVMSALQLAGRVRREGDDYEKAGLIVFELDSSDPEKPYNFNCSPDIENAAAILTALCDNGKQITPELCNEALSRELDGGFGKLKKSGGDEAISVEELLNCENNMAMKKVNDYFRVITSDKITAIVNEDLLPEKSSMTQIIRSSVQIYESKLKKFIYLFAKSQRQDNFEGKYVWLGKYDKDFLGYCADKRIY